MNESYRQVLTKDANEAKAIGSILNFIAENGTNGIALAFSGGVDSTFLLHLLCMMRKEKDLRIIALIMCSEFLSSGESAHAVSIAKAYHVPYKVLSFSPMDIPEVRNNSPERCYHCKRALFLALQTAAQETGHAMIIDGTNADDLHAYRPGIRALQELGIRSPLAELGIGKSAIRACAASLGLKCAKQPSRPCLATRFEYNTTLTPALLQRTEDGEEYLLGLLGKDADLRLRVQGDIARIEVAPRDMLRIMEHRIEVTNHLKKIGFRFTCLDLEGFRSGSYDTASNIREKE